MIKILLAIALLLSPFLAPAQTRRLAKKPPTTTQTATTKEGRTVLLKSDGTWEYSSDPVAPSQPEPSPAPSPIAAAAPSPELAVLSIEAAVVYNVGGAQPVARTDFALLDQPLPKILRDAGLHVGDYEAERNRASRRQFPTMPDFSKLPPKPDTDDNLLTDLALASQFPALGEGQFLSKARDAIKQHTVSLGTSDFSGKLELKDIRPGDYYVMCLAQTRKGYAIWNLPISLKAGANSIILDQRNAAIAF